MNGRSERRSSRFALVLQLLVPAALLLQGCSDGTAEASPPQSPPPAISYSDARISFAPVSLPLVKAATGVDRQVSSLLNVPDAFRYGDFRWNEEGVPPGKTWVLVDLKAQTMSVFRGTHEIGTAVTLYGVDYKPTPLGRFPIIEKREDHWSNLYDAPMPYMLRLTMDGVAIHGSDVREGAGTRGCLGVPLDFGRKLFETLEVGDEVLIVRDATGHKPVTSRIG
jgi:hypothetical protein